MPPRKQWDRHAILAEVKRQGMNLTGIALDAGLYASACRQGLMGKSRPGAEASASAIGIPFRELVHDAYLRGRHSEGKTNSNDRCKSSQKPGADLDNPPAAA